ncbi:MAG: hypothetical protein EXR28_06875 [Betaproteobacteria bacterium]|nr:hypothetical protein [Betaproteobacteria bacterium]
MSDIKFPAGFESLSRFAPDWVLRNPLEKQQRRAERPLAVVQAFNDGLYPEMEGIIDYLITVPMNKMSEADKNLYCLAATWMEMSHPIDLKWNDTDERDVFPFERIHLVEPSPAD